MDIEPELNPLILRVRDSLQGFAAKKDWAKENYRLFMVVNTVWYKFQVTLMASEYDPATGKMNAQYDEVLDYLEEDLKDVPGLYEAVSVFLVPFLGLGFPGSLDAGGNWVEVDFGLLNPGVEDLRWIGDESRQG